MTERRSRGSLFRWQVVAFAVGGLVAFLGGGGGDVAAPLDRPCLWLADRGRDRVVGLGDGDLPVVAVPLPAPRFVRSRPGGGVWVVGDGPSGGSRLWKAGPGPTAVACLARGPLLDLGVLATGEAVVIEAHAAGTAIVGVEEGRVRTLLRLGGARCLAVAGDRILVGRERGVCLVRAGREPVVLDWGRIARAAVQVAPGPRPGTWWVLEEGASGTVHFLGPDLVPRWSRSSGLTQPRMAPVPGAERVWLADGKRGWVVRLGPRGSLELEGIELPLRAIGEGVATTDGSVTWCAVGAVLTLGPRGELVRTQGGFGVLASVAKTAGISLLSREEPESPWESLRSAQSAPDSN